MNRNSYTTGNSTKTQPSSIGGRVADVAMLNSAYDERITMRAWESLLEGRIEPTRSSLPVRSAINDSWHRCASGGIDAQRNEAPIETDKDAVEALARSSSELLTAAARPFEAMESCWMVQVQC
ncbi:hypothetical protein AJ87_41720 [Rhizobium yanglingense]|nr:hypothetical protein AJ87_41720 [Rhizobium yanglingense]